MFCDENEFIIPQTGQPDRPATIFVKEQHNTKRNQQNITFTSLSMLLLLFLSLGFIGFITNAVQVTTTRISQKNCHREKRDREKDTEFVN